MRNDYQELLQHSLEGS